MTALPQVMDEAAILREHEDGQRRVLTEGHDKPAMSALGAFVFETVKDMNRAIVEQLPAPTFPPRIVTDSITTSRSRDVAKLVDQITDDPARFAVRYLTLETLVFTMREQVVGLLGREVL